ncbi:MAG: NAD(P)/FAD-dependent oxidoreductase [Hyphomicrobiaceae bacterium]
MSDQRESAVTQRPYWWEFAEPPALPSQSIQSDCDVVVVGAGYTGLAAARVLAKAGRRVQVFDSQRPGEGASTRNGGIASGSLRLNFAEAIARLGKTQAITLYQEAEDARTDLWCFIDEEGIDCDVRRHGRFMAALHPNDYDALGRECDLLNRHFDVGAEMVPRSDQSREVGSTLYFGGMMRLDSGHLNPAKLHAGLIAAASKAGATIHGETAVNGYQRSGDQFEVATARGKMSCRNIVMATNGYTDEANPWLRRRLVPVTSRIIVTEPLSENLMSHLMPHGRAMSEVRKLYRYYRPSPDGRRIVIGGRETMLSKDPHRNIQHIKNGLVHIFPELADVSIEYSWNGYVAFSRDERPRLFEHDGVVYACGYCGSGVVWARWLGEKAAQKILGSPEANSVFDGPPPRSVPLYWGKPWFIPLAIGLYGLQDRGAGRYRGG